MLIGEFISLGVAISWTATALFADVASHRMGSVVLNVIRMGLSLLFLMGTLWVTIGVPYPLMADGETWLWLGLSGFVGYVLGDYCLFQSYVLMGSRFGQLFMTLASPAAAITAWFLLGEQMSGMALLGMIITITGIGMSVLNKGNEGHKLQLKLPLKGVLMGIGAGVGQGVGLVFSKVGMEHYEAALQVANLDLGYMMPFASTMIRAIIGMAGFCMALFFFSHKGGSRLAHGLSDGKGMSCAIGAALFGPFIGVSLSLMATLYTNAGIAQTIMAMTPVFILLPSRLFFKQNITKLEVTGAIISVVGVSLFFI